MKLIAVRWTPRLASLKWSLVLAMTFGILSLESLATAQNAANPSRTWTDASGTFTVEATMIGMANGKVSLLRADGRRVDVPLDKLSQADQQYVMNATAGTPAVGGKPLPFDTSLVSSDFAGAIVVQPQRVLQSGTFGALSKLSPVPVETKLGGVDLSQLEWLVLLITPSEEKAIATEVSPFGPEPDAAAAPRQPEPVVAIAISKLAFDRDAMAASFEFGGREEAMLGDKVHWKVPEGTVGKPDVVFIDERTMVVAETPLMTKAFQAQGSGKELIAVLGQLDLSHDIALAFVTPATPADPAGDDEGGDPFAKVVKTIDSAVTYVDLGTAPKISASLFTADGPTAEQTKTGIEAAMGFVKLMATQVLPDQWKALPVDAAPLNALINDTLGSFQCSVEGNAVKVNLATPADFLERAAQCGPIVQAIIMKQMRGPAGDDEGPSPLGPGGGNDPNPFGPGGGATPPGANPTPPGGDFNPFGSGGATPPSTPEPPASPSPF